MNTPYTFIFVGRSGSGKGTQINLLKQYITDQNSEIGTYSFVMGDMFRSFMKEDGYAQEAIRSIVQKGGLVPDVITNSLFTSELLHNLKSNQHLYIDGIPRSPGQSDAVMQACTFYNRINPIIINIEVGAEEVEKRMLSRNRSDDSKEAIIGRLKFYEEQVVPAIEHLKNNSGYTYIEINGERPIEDIHLDLIEKLKQVS